MVPIYSSTELKTSQREIKKIAEKQIVYITENGAGKYVFMSQEVFDREIERRIDEHRYEQQLTEALEQSRADFESGRYVIGVDNLRASVQKLQNK